MSSSTDVPNTALRAVLGNASLIKGILAINAASAATVKTTSALSYTIDSVQYAKTALAAQSIVVTHDFNGLPVAAGLPAYVQPVSTTVYYAVCLDAAGAVTIAQGTYAGQAIAYAADLSKVLVGKGGLPLEPANTTVIGLIKVTTNGATTFTPGTTALDAAGVTVAYFDVARMPVTAP